VCLCIWVNKENT